MNETKMCPFCDAEINQEGECSDDCSNAHDHLVQEGLEMGEHEYAAKYHKCPMCDKALDDGNCPDGHWPED